MSYRSLLRSGDGVRREARERQPRQDKPTRRETQIEQLLDAAFRELQHDTGPQDQEWLHSRRILKERFEIILGFRKAEPER